MANSLITELQQLLSNSSDETFRESITPEPVLPQMTNTSEWSSKRKNPPKTTIRPIKRKKTDDISVPIEEPIKEPEVHIPEIDDDFEIEKTLKDETSKSPISPKFDNSMEEEDVFQPIGGFDDNNDNNDDDDDDDDELNAQIQSELDQIDEDHDSEDDKNIPGKK